MSFLFNYLQIFCFVVVITVVKSDSGDKPPVLWQNLSDFVLKWSHDFGLKYKPLLDDLLRDSVNVSQSCAKSLVSTIDGVIKFDDWSVQMVNSWGNFPPAGLFSKLTLLKLKRAWILLHGELLVAK